MGRDGTHILWEGQSGGKLVSLQPTAESGQLLLSSTFCLLGPLEGTQHLWKVQDWIERACLDTAEEGQILGE